MDITSLNLFSESVEKNIDYEITLNHYNNLHNYIESHICRIGYSPEVFCEDAKDFLQKAGDVFRNVIEVIIRFFKTVWNTIANWVLNLFSKKRKEQLKEINEKIDETIKGIDEKLKGVKKENFEADSKFCKNIISKIKNDNDKIAPEGLADYYGVNPIVKALRNMIFAKRDGSLSRFKNALGDFKVEIKSPDFIDLFKTPVEYFGALARFHKEMFDHVKKINEYDKQEPDAKESEDRKEQALDALSRIIKNLKAETSNRDEILAFTVDNENESVSGGSSKTDKARIDIPTADDLKKYRAYINSIKKCYPIANNMFNLIARYYGESEPNDFKWVALEDMKADDLTKNRINVDQGFKTNSNIFIQRICSAVIVKSQVAVVKGSRINKAIQNFLVDITKVITKIKEEL